MKGSARWEECGLERLRGVSGVWLGRGWLCSFRLGVRARPATSVVDRSHHLKGPGSGHWESKCGPWESKTIRKGGVRAVRSRPVFGRVRTAVGVDFPLEVIYWAPDALSSQMSWALPHGGYAPRRRCPSTA